MHIGLILVGVGAVGIVITSMVATAYFDYINKKQLIAEGKTWVHRYNAVESRRNKRPINRKAIPKKSTKEWLLP
jgi:hypothetical protein